MSRALCAASMLFATVITGAGSAAAADEGIKLMANQTRVLRLVRPADTVAIGDPELLDVVVQDSKTVVLTGKGRFGVTNIVALDAEGRAILDDTIIVGRDDSKITRVYRRDDVQMLSCTPFCEKAYQNTGAVN
ncbi:hypothetical protein GCM10011491_16600 [Brucella endophytica]|uniref:Pilus formation protein N-terminal domain-containing protein n=2 Tax=Brucella endophytica TaxID=1963359 RepID=A0A916S8S9_9HYPH|nr:hypothetical protein GCM10011491_16600 [Brucella endophytica]